jgi:translocation and assembly module TamA
MACAQGLDYGVAIRGVSNSKLHDTLKEISDTVTVREERPPLTVPMLRRRAEEDIPKFLKALRAYGYYGADVRLDIDREPEPISVTFEVSEGPLYSLKPVEIDLVEEETAFDLKLPAAKELGLVAGEPGRAQTVLEGQERLLKHLQRQGFPFPKMAERKVTVDHEERSVAVLFRIEPGPAARFGRTEIEGLESVEESLLQEKIPWQEGDCYDAELLRELHERLNSAGIFAMVRVTRGDALEDEGRLPITITVVERKHRSVGVGISYKTDEELGAKVSWEHRNLLHRGERLAVSAHLSRFTQALEGSFRKPHFGQPDQLLVLNTRLAEDSPDAYTSRSFRTEAIVERDLNREMTGSVGFGIKTSEVDQLGEEDAFELLFLLLGFDRDTTDEPLDPRRGGRLALQVSPFHDIGENDLAFARGRIDMSRYVGLLINPSVVLAGRVALGAMTAVSSLEGVPADERFYAGGGGSIRGYPYQTVGPLENGEPVGGRSLLEISTEVRLKVTERMGLVAFLDGGKAFEDNLPDLDDDLLWGAGLGLRYFTPIGPFRFDVAVPLDKRSEVDDDFQVYVSLQHAF